MKKIEEKIDREYEILVKEPELGEEVDKKHEHTTATKEINKKSYVAARDGVDALLKKLEEKKKEDVSERKIQKTKEEFREEIDLGEFYKLVKNHEKMLLSKPNKKASGK
ncbi:MAG: hypothetical protein KAQ84_03145 [Thermoplasmatales archaeon]|nr:hypothetical protein [Thermoplasmatales archaeon]